MLILAMFDFDGTLFKSPDKPSDWGPGSWVIESESLNPPCVPLKPGPQWWIESTVSAAKRSISDPNVWAILCTGRADGIGGFRYRIPELLKQKGLNFDEVLLNPGGDTEAFKKAVIKRITKKYPDITTVQIWEDHNLPSFMSFVKSLGLVGIPHPVKVKHPECDQDPVRLASQWMRKVMGAVGTQADIDRFLPDFKRNWLALLKVRLEEEGKLPGDHNWVRRVTNRPWVGVINSGAGLAKALLTVKAIPRGFTKKMEMAARVFMSARRMPKNIFKWMDKTIRHYQLLLTAAEVWDDKAEGGDELFTLGPFKVHNTIGIEGKKLDDLKANLKKAVQLLKKVKVKGIQRVLYGDVNIVGRLSKGSVGAWYYPADDTLYVRSLPKGKGPVHFLIHELGHRYWERFASRDQKQAWAQHHHDLEFGVRPDFNVPYPQVGEEIEIVKAKGRGKNRRKPVVQKIQGEGIGGTYFVDDRRYYTGMQFYTFYRDQAERSKFPTDYAAKDMEEHFCEALALRALGTLPADHVAFFDEIWG